MLPEILIFILLRFGSFRLGLAALSISQPIMDTAYTGWHNCQLYPLDRTWWESIPASPAQETYPYWLIESGIWVFLVDN
jgi:hypothetical protein